MNKKLFFFILTGVLSGVYWRWHVIQGKTNQIVRIGFAGDVMLGRLVNEKISQTDFDYPWGSILPLLHHNDVNIINLETTLTRSINRIPKVFNFKSDPKNVQALKRANITIVNLANNHSMDFGIEGLLETIKTLDDAGILHVGAGETLEEAQKPAIVEKNGIKIGVIGFTDNEPTWLATETKPGTNYVKVGDIETIKKVIEPIRKQVDILILTIHWGPNMRQRPSQEFIDFAHQIIDLGVDILHGHSSHVFQGIEIYKNKLIMYDTGDFVDDYMVDPILRNDRSFLFNVEVAKQGVYSLNLLPITIQNMQVNKISDSDKSELFSLIHQLSKELGTELNNNGIIFKQK